MTPPKKTCGVPLSVDPFPQTVWSLEILTARVKARCLIEVLIGAFG